jgi:hypothetical protein
MNPHRLPRPRLLVLLVMLCLGLQSQAQMQVLMDFETVFAQPGQSPVCLQVKTTGFAQVITFQFSINYDANYLVFLNAQNYNSNITDFGPANISNPALGVVGVSWIGSDFVNGHTVPDGDVWVELCFAVSDQASGMLDVTASGSPIIVEIVNANGVELGLTANVGGVQIGVAPPPVEVTLGTTQAFGLCPDSTLNLCMVVPSYFPNSGLSFEWVDENGNVVSAAQSDNCLTLVASSPDVYGSYFCVVGNPASPDTVFTSAAFIVVEQEECAPVNAREVFGADHRVAVFPNPSSDRTDFEFNLSGSQHVQLRVYDAAGTLCHQWSGHLQEGKHTLRWEAGNLPAGTYWYQLQLGAEPIHGILIRGR